MVHNILEYLVGTTGSNHSIDRTCFWTFVSALAAIGVLLVAWVQLRNINKTTRADFLHKFTESFFSSDCLKLVMLFEYGLILFEKKEIHGIGEYLYFEVDKKWTTIANFLDKSVADSLKERYADYEVDELLGYFEDIGNYKKTGFLEIQMLYEVFGAYIEIIWGNMEIQKYIKVQRKLYGKDMYSGFEYIYNEVVKHKGNLKIQ